MTSLKAGVFEVPLSPTIAAQMMGGMCHPRFGCRRRVLPIAAASAVRRAGFVAGTVFDVSQTEPTRERGGIDWQRMDELRQDAADVGRL
jgi:hypothetical protein